MSHTRTTTCRLPASHVGARCPCDAADAVGGQASTAQSTLHAQALCLTGSPTRLAYRCAAHPQLPARAKFSLPHALHHSAGWARARAPPRHCALQVSPTDPRHGRCTAPHAPRLSVASLALTLALALALARTLVHARALALIHARSLALTGLFRARARARALISCSRSRSRSRRPRAPSRHTLTPHASRLAARRPAHRASCRRRNSWPWRTGTARGGVSTCAPRRAGCSAPSAACASRVALCRAWPPRAPQGRRRG